MQGWYKAEVDLPQTPDRALATMTAERKDIYRHVPLSGEPIPVEDLLFLVNDEIPEDEEIAWAVCRLCLNCSGGVCCDSPLPPDSNSTSIA